MSMSRQILQERPLIDRRTLADFYNAAPLGGVSLLVRETSGGEGSPG